MVLKKTPTKHQEACETKNVIEAYHNTLVSASIQIEPSAIKDCFCLAPVYIKIGSP